MRAILVVALIATPAFAQRAPALADAQVRQQILDQSIADYQATGHPYACPYNLERNGRSCGRVSAYSRPDGAAPLCYAKDVTAGMVADWPRAHGE